MIVMAMGYQDQVDLAQGVEVLVFRRRFWVGGKPRVDHDHLPSGGDDLHRGLAEPLYLDLAALRPAAPGGEHDQQTQCKSQMLHVPILFFYSNFLIASCRCAAAPAVCPSAPYSTSIALKSLTLVRVGPVTTRSFKASKK